MLSPLRNGILFAFVDEVTGGAFHETTRFGLIVRQSSQNALQKGRWARVLAIGPDVKEVKTGSYIFIEPLMWTKGLTHDGIKIWKTDESKVMIVSEERPDI